MPKAVLQTMDICLTFSQLNGESAMAAHSRLISSLSLLNYCPLKLQLPNLSKALNCFREEFKKSLFADDTSFIRGGSLKSFENLIDVMDILAIFQA